VCSKQSLSLANLNEEIAVIVNASNGSALDAEVQKVHLPAGERLARAGKRLGILWGAAIVCLFIPIVHFLLVPLFLITGLALAIVAFLGSIRIIGSELICPDCKNTFNLPETRESWPIDYSCPRCTRYLWIERRDSQEHADAQ